MYKSWDQLSVVEQLQCEYSDFFKEVHGFRPRSASDEQWNSEEWLKEQMASLSAQSEEVNTRESQREKVAIAKFETRVAAAIAAGAKTRKTAIKWLFDAEEDEYVHTDPDYFCHQHGLPYGYFTPA